MREAPLLTLFRCSRCSMRRRTNREREGSTNGKEKIKIEMYGYFVYFTWLEEKGRGNATDLPEFRTTHSTNSPRLSADRALMSRKQWERQRAR